MRFSLAVTLSLMLSFLFFSSSRSFSYTTISSDSFNLYRPRNFLAASVTLYNLICRTYAS